MRRKIFDSLNHAYFVTFACYRRRRLLDDDRAKGIVVHYPKKAGEKLSYRHHNPVKTGLVNKPEEWHFGSARWYLLNKSVGVPIERMV